MRDWEEIKKIFNVQESRFANTVQEILSNVYKVLKNEGVFQNPEKVFANIGESKPWRYQFVMNELRLRDVSKDRKYQRAFGGFYQIRLKWYKKFYYVLEKSKHRKKAKRLTLKEVMRSLYRYNHSFEYSFASKLLHTVNPSNPVIDKKVLSCLGLRRPQRPNKTLSKSDIDTLFNAYEAQYELVRKVYQLFLKKPEVKKLFIKFDARFPDLARIGEMKKIDLILWQLK